MLRRSNPTSGAQRTGSGSDSSDSRSDGPAAPQRFALADDKGKGKMVTFEEDPPSSPGGFMADARRPLASGFMVDARWGISPPLRHLASVAVRVGDPMEAENRTRAESRFVIVDADNAVKLRHTHSSSGSLGSGWPLFQLPFSDHVVTVCRNPCRCLCCGREGHRSRNCRSRRPTPRST